MTNLFKIFVVALCSINTALATSTNPVKTSESASAQALQANLYANVLTSNYRTGYYSFELVNSADFFMLQSNYLILKDFIGEQVEALCLIKQFNPQKCDAAHNAIKKLYVKKTSLNNAAQSLAIWLYRLDGENWFTLDKALTETSKYFADESLSLFTVQNFDPEGVLATGYVQTDLPVVFDSQEKTISFWLHTLLD